MAAKKAPAKTSAAKSKKRAPTKPRVLFDDLSEWAADFSEWAVDVDKVYRAEFQTPAAKRKLAALVQAVSRLTERAATWAVPVQKKFDLMTTSSSPDHVKPPPSLY